MGRGREAAAAASRSGLPRPEASGEVQASMLSSKKTQQKRLSSSLHRLCLRLSFAMLYPRVPRRGARVVDRDGLENRCTFTGTVSSNLTLSAT